MVSISYCPAEKMNLIKTLARNIIRAGLNLENAGLCKQENLPEQSSFNNLQSVSLFSEILKVKDNRGGNLAIAILFQLLQN